MPDVFTPEKRSWVMSRVKNRNTTPEKRVRSLLHRLGFRFRLHHKKLLGHPDIMLPKYRKVVFVHGCFWHGHDCPRAKRPATNQEFWNEKIEKNRERDDESLRKLKELGWDSLVVWQCETRDRDTATLAARLRDFLSH